MLVLPTGQVGDEGLFRFAKSDPQMSLQNGATFTTQEFIDASGLAADENNLDKVDGVAPLDADDIAGLADQDVIVCAVVYDSDISSDVDPPFGNLKGATQGITAFEVTAATPHPSGGSNLPLITVKLVSVDVGCAPQTFCKDADGDGFGSTDLAQSVEAFTVPDGFAEDCSDCDDTNGAVNPGVAEIEGNGIDDDCDPGTLDSPAGAIMSLLD